MFIKSVSNVTVTGTPGSQLSYRVTADGTGFCVGYWDQTVPAAAYLFSGTATADNGTCS